jgi:hypothetical protein
MMRANLLPRPKEMVAVFGLEFDAEYLRQALLGALVAIFVAAIGIGIETLRLHRIENAAGAEQTVLAERAPERDEAKRLALDVARYQEIAREEATVRRSGSLAAVSIARIGNAVPSRVWLDSITRDANGFELSGGARSVDALSNAMAGLGDALPGRKAALVNIDHRDPTLDGVHFAARLPEPAPSPQEIQ